MAHATMAAASALASGNLSSHLSRPHAASDSRLLANLIKSERNYINNLHSSVMSAHAASSALSAWGTSEAHDVSEASARLADLLSASADVQSTHVAAIEGYRAALKDVADREASIRNVVRDRDILVGRLIKASNKSVNTSSKSKKSPEERAEKVHMAQRELQACEEILAQEEAALVGVKRRTFKEALTMRMKTMGDAGAAMVEAAKEAILLLDEFDSSAHQRPLSPGYDDQVTDNGNRQDWYAYPHHRQSVEERNEERIAANHPNFENSSVTPSQSASQIYQPQFQQRNSAAYSAPFQGIGEDEGDARRYSQQQRQAEEDSDSDDEDWKRSFGQGQETTVHQGGSALPAPHQLSADAGTQHSFLPFAHEAAPAPAPPAKDSDRHSTTPSRTQSVQKKKKKSKSSDRYDQFGPPTTVSMPPVPTAPSLNSNGIYMEPIPTAPKLYIPGASGHEADSSVDSYSRPDGRYRGQNGEDASSDGGRTARQSSRPDGPKRGNSFFGRMGRLFKTDVKGETKSSQGRSRRESVGSSTWNTRTDALAKETRKMAGPLEPSTLSRRQSVLTGPLVRDETNSSDEEPIDEKNAIRITNPKRPMWQAPQKASSDVGSRNYLSNELSRPASVKRTPSASVTPGPASWKSRLDEEVSTQRIALAGGATTTLVSPGLSRSNSVSTSVKKKKKKSKTPSLAGGSEIGTDSTRTKLGNVDAATNQRSSVIVPGDASAGVRRSDSLNYGSPQIDGAKLQKKSSKRRSIASTQNLYDHSASGRLSNMSPGAVDRQSKFSTSNWVAKSTPEEPDAADMKTIPATTTAAPASPKRQSIATTTPSTPSKLKQSHTPTSAAAASTTGVEDETEPKHKPQPSATMSPPLKPALKVPGSAELARSGSVTSSAAGSVAPILPPPISAPPPVTSMQNLNDNNFTSARPDLNLPDNNRNTRMSIEEDKRFDGTGRLGVSDYREPQKEQFKSKRNPVALPRIDMPPSEPFRVDLESRAADKNATPVKDSSGGDVLTPGERSVYQSYLSQHADTPEKLQDSQPSGVTRFTDRIASVGRGVLGMRTGSPQKPSQQAPAAKLVSPTKPAPEQPMSPPSATVAMPLPGQLSRTYSDQNVAMASDSSDEEALPIHTVTPATPVISEAPPPPVNSSLSNKNNGLPVASSHPETAASSVDGGSTIGRRKSVRMAPNVKLPPESPGLPPASQGGAFDYTAPGSMLSSRIAPPPQAPPRISASETRAIDLGAHPREVQGWSVRATPMDDSSDEEEGEYQQARKQFGSISRSWKKSTKKSSGEAASEGGSIKKKKKKASSNSGYNPAIPLPKGMEVVGRSNSVRR